MIGSICIFYRKSKGQNDLERRVRDNLSNTQRINDNRCMALSGSAVFVRLRTVESTWTVVQVYDLIRTLTHVFQVVRLVLVNQSCQWSESQLHFRLQVLANAFATCDRLGCDLVANVIWGLDGDHLITLAMI